MKRNRIICLMLVLILSTSTIIMPTFAENGSGVSEIEVLSELGIVKGYEDGKLHPEYNITRMEYAALIIRCLGYDGENPSVDTVFNDVPKDSWGAASVQFAYDLGIINGYGDGTFGPDDNILEVDAVKIIVSALGRGLEAEAGGGYPTGYLSIAQRLKLMKDYKGGNAKATRGFVATLIANALEVSIVEQNFTSNAYTETYGRTMLSILGLTKYKGKLTAVSGTNIDSDENVFADEIVISGKKFKTDKSFSAEFVGEQIMAYVYKYGESDEKVIAVFTSADESENLTVQAKDISEKTNFKKFIYQKGNKEKEIDLPAGFSVTYNGTLINKSVYITPERLKPVQGWVKLIDTDDDKKYDMAIVKEYKTFVVKTVTEDAIYDIYGNSIIFEKNEENSVFVVKKGEKTAKWEDIAYGDVLSVAANVDNTVAEIIISDKAVNGHIISNATRDGILYYRTADGDEYRTTPEYNKARSKEYKEAVEIQLNNKYVLKLNVFDEIAFVEEYVPEENEEYIASTDRKQKYAFLCDAAVISDAMTETLEVKLLTTNNRLECFKTTNEKSVRFGRPEGSIYAIGKATPSEIYAKILNADNRVTRQVVKYVLNENGEITEFYVPDSREDTENLSRDTNRTNVAFAYNTVGQNYHYDENTVLFMLTGNGDRDTNIICTTPGRYLTNRATYNAELWDIDSDGYINCICLYPATGENENTVTYSFVIDCLNDPVMLVTDVVEELNEDGILYKIVEGYEDGKKVRRLMSDGLSQISTIRPGMVIQYGTNSDNLKYAYYADDDEVMIGYQIMFDCTEYEHKPFMSYDHKETRKASAKMNYGYGTVTRVDYPYMVVSTGNNKSMLHAEVMVLKYNVNSGIIEKADTLQIVEGQKVFIRKRLDNLREVIILE